MFARPRTKKPLLVPPPKRRKATPAIEEINFDIDARADYLTGFHKRKLHRAKQAKEEAAKKAREERILLRKQLREGRRKELEEHVEAVNALLKNTDATNPSDMETSEGMIWNGIDDDPPVEPIDHETEYSDEDRFTTVTVEEVGISKEGLHKIVRHQCEDNVEANTKERAVDSLDMKAKQTSKKDWPKVKKFRYESKAERKIIQGKQKAANKARANARRGND